MSPSLAPVAARARAARLTAVMVCLAAFVAGCSPEYDWREIRPAEGGFAVLLPGKPASMSRPIDLDGMKVTMTMHGAKVGSTTFTVGWADLPDAADATRERAVAAMRTAMVRNLAGSETSSAPVALPVTDAAGARRGTHPAQRVDASGSVSGQPMAMLAGFTARGGRAWQYVVMGPMPDAAQAATFLDSFRLVE